MVQRYQKRISGPLMDRFDIHIEVPRVDYEKLTPDGLGEPSEQVRARAEAARAVQRERFRGTKLACNADMGPAEVREFCAVAARQRASYARRRLHLRLWSVW